MERRVETIVGEPLELLVQETDYIPVGDENQPDSIELNLASGRSPEIIDSNHAFLELVLAAHTEVLKIAYNLCRDPDFVEELVQLYHLKLWEGKCGDLRDLAKLGTTIYGPIRRHLYAIFVDMYRRKKAAGYAFLRATYCTRC